MRRTLSKACEIGLGLFVRAQLVGLTPRCRQSRRLLSGRSHGSGLSMGRSTSEAIDMCAQLVGLTPRCRCRCDARLRRATRQTQREGTEPLPPSTFLGHLQSLPSLTGLRRATRPVVALVLS